MLFQLKNTFSSMSGTNSLVLTFNNNVTYIVHPVILQVILYGELAHMKLTMKIMKNQPQTSL